MVPMVAITEDRVFKESGERDLCKSFPAVCVVIRYKMFRDQGTGGCENGVGLLKGAHNHPDQRIDHDDTNGKYDDVVERSSCQTFFLHVYSPPSYTQDRLVANRNRVTSPIISSMTQAMAAP